MQASTTTRMQCERPQANHRRATSSTTCLSDSAAGSRSTAVLRQPQSCCFRRTPAPDSSFGGRPHCHCLLSRCAMAARRPAGHSSCRSARRGLSMQLWRTGVGGRQMRAPGEALRRRTTTRRSRCQRRPASSYTAELPLPMQAKHSEHQQLAAIARRRMPRGCRQRPLALAAVAAAQCWPSEACVNLSNSALPTPAVLGVLPATPSRPVEALPNGVGSRHSLATRTRHCQTHPNSWRSSSNNGCSGNDTRAP
mmetsp:Transcript_39505/g.126647  ORF Transcript_39505/g.126647 Transcript_39505/m.126647 type:complete len:252 (-) Transcript_39505:2374-3129(-)